MARLSLLHLTKTFGAQAAVRDVTLEVRDGELMCLLGPSGCGKTTTLRMIGGFALPDAGDIQINDRSVVALPPEKRPTAMVFQRYNLWPHMTVAGNIAFGLKLRRLPREAIAERVRDVLGLVGLPGFSQKYPHQLSGGEQQRVAVARALVLEPQILLLDEPFSNLDARLRVHMREEVKQLQRKVGITTVFVTHDQEEALTIADRIAVMNEGVLQQVDAPGTLYHAPANLFVAGFIGSPAMNMLPASKTGPLKIAGAEVGVANDLDVRERREQLTEKHLRLHAREPSTETEVGAETEREVVVRLPAHVEPLRVVEVRDDQPGVERGSDAVTGEVAHHAVAEPPGIGLDHPADGVQRPAGRHHADAAHHRLAGALHEKP